MPRQIDNAYLLSQYMEEKFGENEFDIEQFFEETEDFLGLGDNRTHQKYLEFCIRYNQITRKESGKFVATPNRPITPRMRLADIKNRRRLAEMK